MHFWKAVTQKHCYTGEYGITLRNSPHHQGVRRADSHPAPVQALQRATRFGNVLYNGPAGDRSPILFYRPQVLLVLSGSYPHQPFQEGRGTNSATDSRETARNTQLPSSEGLVLSANITEHSERASALFNILPYGAL